MDTTTQEIVSDESSVNESVVSNGVAQKQDDKVAYESYSKVLNQLKTSKAEKAALVEELAALKSMAHEMESLKASKSETTEEIKALYTQKAKELEAERERNKAIVKDFTGRTIKSSFVSKFKEEGCLDPELLFLEAETKGKLKGIEVNQDDFTLDAESLSSLLGEYKKEKAHLFGKQASAVKSEHVKVESQKIKSPEEMSIEELRADFGIIKGKI